MRRSAAVIVLAALFAAGCSADSGSADNADADPAGEVTTTSPATTTTSEAPAEVIEATATVSPVEGNPMAARVMIDSSVAVTARITATSDDHVVSTPTTAATTAVHDLPLVGLRADRDYELTITLTAPSGATATLTDGFTSGPLPADLPELEIVSDPDRAAPGVTILELNPVIAAAGIAGNAVVGVDEAGEYVWYHNSGTFSGAVQRSADGHITMQHDPFAFSVHDATGRRLAEYYPDPTGTDEITESPDGVRLVPFHADWVELHPIHHDLLPLDDGSFIGLSTTDHEVPLDRQAELCPDDPFEWDVFSDVVVHIDADGTVLRTWDLWDILSFDDHPGAFLCNTRGIGVTETRRDWSHANALWFDEENDAIIVSVRHTDQIVSLPMTDQTGPLTDVRWILGADGTIPYEGESFHHTHGVKLAPNGDLLVYDNGNFRPGTVSAGGTEPDYSRAVRIRLDDDGDPSTWRATQVWDHRMTDPLTDAPLYAPFVSDVDELANGNILVTHGGAVWEPANFLQGHVVVVEVVPDDSGSPEGGDIVWQLVLGTRDEPVSMYRADRWESLYFGPLWATD